MAEFLEAFQDPHIIDPLSEVTRKERKSLLVASLIGLAIAKGGLIPQEISTLGIKVSTFERISLLYLLALTLLYFILGFALYASADAKASRVRVAGAADQRRQAIQLTFGPVGAKSAAEDVPIEQLATLADRSALAEDVLKISRLRYIFEFYLPLVAGWIAVALVLQQTKGHSGFRWMVSLAVTVALTLGVVYYLVERDRLKRRWQWWKQKRPMNRLQRKMKQAQKLPENSLKREKLMKEVHELLAEMGRPKTPGTEKTTQGS